MRGSIPSSIRLQSLPNHVPVRGVAALGVYLVAVAGCDLDLDAAVAAVEGSFGPVGQEVLRAKLFAYLLERAFEREHVARVEGPAACVLGQPLNLFVARVL